MAEEQEFKIELEQEVESAPEVNEVEAEAIKYGWKPEGVEGKKHLSADEFLDRKKFYDDIHSLKRQNKRLQESVDAMAAHNKRIAEQERKKVLDALKEAKKEALATNDYDRVVDIDEALLEAKTTKQEVEDTTKSDSFKEWAAENRWYMTDAEKRGYADKVGIEYLRQNPSAPLEDVYEYVTKSVQARFSDDSSSEEEPEKKTTRTSAVDTGSRRTMRTTTPTKKWSVRDLPEADRDIMKAIVRTGTLTEEEYLKQYFND